MIQAPRRIWRPMLVAGYNATGYGSGGPLTVREVDAAFSVRVPVYGYDAYPEIDVDVARTPCRCGATSILCHRHGPLRHEGLQHLGSWLVVSGAHVPHLIDVRVRDAHDPCKEPCERCGDPFEDHAGTDRRCLVGSTTYRAYVWRLVVEPYAWGSVPYRTDPAPGDLYAWKTADAWCSAGWCTLSSLRERERAEESLKRKLLTDPWT